jgi:hypothetical protein
MPRKLSRPDTDVQKLAAELSKRWTPTDGIAPWLRRNGPRLRNMVRDGGWTWTDIGRAMTLAGITYASGTPWTGALLNVKMAQARNHLRTRDAKRTDDGRLHAWRGSRRPAAERQAGIASIAVSAEAPVTDSAREPTFALAALAPTEFSPLTPSDDDRGSNKPPSARKQVDVDEVIRRLQGGGVPPNSED